MEGYLSFKKGHLRFRKVEMKTYWFVLRHDPTNAEFQYLLSWYKDESRKKLKGSLNLLPSMAIITEEFRQFMLGFYFVIRTADNEAFHFAGQSRQSVENWAAQIREAVMTDVYAGKTSANKYMQERIVNTYISNNSLAILHPLTEETILSWRLSQIVSLVFNETDLSFMICPKCNKCAGRFAQQVSMETGIFVVSSLEERLAAIYPGEKIVHEKNVSGDIYKIPHSCKRVDREGIYFSRSNPPVSKSRPSKLFSFTFSCLPVQTLKTSKRESTPKYVQTQPKYKRCPTPTSFAELPESPILPFVRHSSVPPQSRGQDASHSRSAATSPSTSRSLCIDKSVSFQPSFSHEDILGMTAPSKSPSLNSQRNADVKPVKPQHPDMFHVQRAHSQHWINSPGADEWSYNANSRRRDRLGSLDDCLNDTDPIEHSAIRRSLTPCPDADRLLYPDNHARLSIISELDKSFKRLGPMGYDSYSLPIRKRAPDSRACFTRPNIKCSTFQFPIGPLPVKLTKEPNLAEGGKIIINNTEYQLPRMLPDVPPDPIYDVPHHNLSSELSSDTSVSTPAQIGYKPKRYANKRKNSSDSSNLSSTTLSEGLPYSPEDSDSGPDRITML